MATQPEPWGRSRHMRQRVFLIADICGVLGALLVVVFICFEQARQTVCACVCASFWFKCLLQPIWSVAFSLQDTRTLMFSHDCSRLCLCSFTQSFALQDTGSKASGAKSKKPGQCAFWLHGIA